MRAVLVYHEGEPLLERYTGASAEDHLDTQALGESVMSALIGIAIDQGHLEGVDQTLGDLLPDYATAMTPSVAAITLRQVLSQTAGFPADSSASRHASSGSLSTVNTYRESDDWVRTILVDWASGGSGGGDFADLDAGAHLLSAILVEATSQSVLDSARENLFDQLRIPTEPAWESVLVSVDGVADDESYTRYYEADFAWPVDPQGFHEGAGGVRFRPQDLARIGQLYLDDGRWGDDQVVPAAWVEESTSAQVEADYVSEAYGYMWWVTEVDGDPAYLAYGYGGQMIEVVPDRDLVVVLASEPDWRDAVARNEAVYPGEATEMVSSLIAPRFASTVD